MRVFTTLALTTALALTVVATALACGGPAAASSGYSRCSFKHETVSYLRVKDTSCKKAKAVIADFKSISKTFKVDGFKCERLSGGDLAGTWRCANGAQRFRFDFAD
jgi:hypothetical protein